MNVLKFPDLMMPMFQLPFSCKAPQEILHPGSTKEVLERMVSTNITCMVAQFMLENPDLPAGDVILVTECRPDGSCRFMVESKQYAVAQKEKDKDSTHEFI